MDIIGKRCVLIRDKMWTDQENRFPKQTTSFTGSVHTLHQNRPHLYIKHDLRTLFFGTISPCSLYCIRLLTGIYHIFYLLWNKHIPMDHQFPKVSTSLYQIRPQLKNKNIGKLLFWRILIFRGRVPKSSTSFYQNRPHLRKSASANPYIF